MPAFSRGEVRLTCGVSCAGAWGAAIHHAKSLNDNQVWVDLATEVMRIGFGNDLSYYFLGRAAEGMGYVEAAKTYFRLALAHEYKCAGAFNVCDGFVFPRDIQTSLSQLTSRTGSIEATAGTTPGRPADEPQSGKAIEQRPSPAPAQTIRKATDPVEVDVAGKTKIAYDEFKKLTTYEGPNTAPYIRGFLSTIPPRASTPDSPKITMAMAADSIAAEADPRADKRTPEQRYEGAFTAARLLCGATLILSQKVAEAREKGISVEPEIARMADLSACLKKQLADMEAEYKKFIALQKPKNAKDALTDHYVAAVLTVKGISPFIGEIRAAYKDRQTENKRRADEKWVRFELVR